MTLQEPLLDGSERAFQSSYLESLALVERLQWLQRLG